MSSIGIYGYGRFGRLWADIFRKTHQVKVYTRRGLKVDEVDEGVEICTEEALFEADAIFFCVAISSFENVLKQCAAYIKPNTVIFDTCSVKVYPVQWMLNCLPKGTQIIATHPMFGPDSYYNATSALPIALHNITANETVYKQWKAWFQQRNMRLEEMTPEEHDKKVAYSQGITHYIGRVLADLDLSATTIDTLGYKKLMEIIEQTCNDSWQLFMDLQRYNPYTVEMRENLNDSLHKVFQVLQENVIKE